MSESKPWWESKTIWIQVGGVVIELLSWDQLGSIVPETWRAPVAYAVFAVTIITRMMSTSQPISLTRKGDAE